MAKIQFRNLAHSEDSTASASKTGQRHTAIFDAWADCEGGETMAELLKSAQALTDLDVTEIHVAQYVAGIRDTILLGADGKPIDRKGAPMAQGSKPVKVYGKLFAALPAIVATPSAGRGRVKAEPVAESSLLALLKSRKGKSDSAAADDAGADDDASGESA